MVDQVSTSHSGDSDGAISANGHASESEVPGAQEMYFTAGPSLRNHAASASYAWARRRASRGELPPIQGAVVAMHTAMYADHDDVGCVLHTHSPTPRPLPSRIVQSDVARALAMFAVERVQSQLRSARSDQAVANIRAAITRSSRVLLANHAYSSFTERPSWPFRSAESSKRPPADSTRCPRRTRRSQGIT